jgi:2-polyprenyl-3-methyl-5-hydroxy-6-metoxy-1,4-benzoquinol methylase
VDATVYEANERLEQTHWWFEGRRQVIRQVMRKHLTPRDGRRLLDVGCGTGGMFPLLEELGSVEGAEASADARERAARRFGRFTVHTCELPNGLPQGKWDVITAFDVIEHVDEPVEGLSQMRTRLGDGGQVVITVPAFQFLWSQHDEIHHHRRRYDRALLTSQLTSAGFRVRFMSYFNAWLFPAVAGVRLLGKVLPMRNGHASDLSQPPDLVNRALTHLFSSERFAVGATQLPFGVSMIAVTDPRPGA